jgi:serine/threonine-protein kinase
MSGNEANSTIYTFDGFTVDAEKRCVYRVDGESLALMPKAFEILLYLVRNADRVVDKDELMSELWPHTVVEENNVTQNIYALRRALGERHRDNRFIATVPGRGYKFVAKVSERHGPSGPENLDSTGTLPERPVEHEDALPASETRSDRFRPFATAAAILVLILAGAAGVWLLKNRAEAGRSDRVEIIAVLPFKPIGSGERDESLELGMAESLISKLSGGLTVRPLSAVRRFGSPEQDAVEAGRALGADAVLDGNIQTAGDRIRVSAALTRTSDGKRLWSGQFVEGTSDIFALQDSISERVAKALSISLGGGGIKRYTQNVEAYQLYLKGNLHAFRLVGPEVQKGIAYYEQAIAVDPNYALGYVGLANAYRGLALTTDAPPGEVMPKSREAAEKAIALDDSLSDAWAALATSTFWYEFDWQSADQQFRKAVDLDPNNAQAHLFYAHMLSNIGRHDAALAEIGRAKEADPIGLTTNAIYGQILLFAGRTDEALDQLKSVLDMNPDFWLAHLFLSRAYLAKGMLAESVQEASRANSIAGENAESAALAGYGLARSGDTDGARRVLAQLEQRAASTYVPKYDLAVLHAGLGENSKALDMLEASYARREPLMVFLAVEPKWDALRAEPRFAALMKKMRFP